MGKTVSDLPSGVVDAAGAFMNLFLPAVPVPLYSIYDVLVHLNKFTIKIGVAARNFANKMQMVTLMSPLHYGYGVCRIVKENCRQDF